MEPVALRAGGVELYESKWVQTDELALISYLHCLVMRPVIVSTDPDLSHFIFQQEGKLFKSWYPDTFTEVFGRQNVGSLHGFMYKYLKNMVLNLFGPESLKKMLPEVEQAACRNLMRWSSQDSVDLKDATASMIFDLTAKKLISYDSEKSPENLRENFVAFMKGLISFPLNIPGTAYHKCLQEEHEAILRRRENPNSGLTWKEYKSMTFTFQFINETVRLANIVPAIFRKALREIKYQGYTIPAGWAVMVCPPAVHLNPAKYKDPLHFNPWRWEGMEMNGASKNFMAFGGGMRFCVGTDFTKVQMAVFLHCLVTKYRWQAIKGGEIVRTPGLQFPNGFHVQITEKNALKQEQTSNSI
ncbi:Cytochrome P450 87A3 like [Actinidia chinensis var. chinensis]|uniref:Cytochrome P450 87A3 like n=1 Tax=Actinidia chinensis var. chinensis TaxID=1590841 RepID=A0A2R6PI13_ACTCC|nr:Cytochrome P450 87A3 like [Actinidia chinensis var. chinensis]